MAQAKKSAVSSAKTPEVDAEEAAIWVDIADLMPWDQNPRINDAAVPGVAASIKRFGFASPIIARKANGEIIAGHTRLKAAQSLGLSRVPVRYMDLDPADAHLLAIADNKLNEKAEWDNSAVAEILSAFSLDDAELAGFDSDELEKLGSDLLGNDKGAPSDDVPEPPAEPVTKLGDVWILGDHRLVCGDSTDPETVRLAIASNSPRLILTDPPYGVDYVGKTADKKPVHNDDRAGLETLLREALGNALGMTEPGCVWYVCSPAGSNVATFMRVLCDMGVFRQMLIWVKQSLVLGHSDYHYRHEPIFYGWTPGAKHREPPDRKQDTVWEFDRPTRSVEHPTMKPVPLFEKAVLNSTGPGDTIFDPFCGSGTSLLAAEAHGRSCCGVEFSPAYCDVIVKRWEDYTGKKATLEAKKAA